MNIIQQITEAAAGCDCSVTILGVVEAEPVRQLILTQYCRGRTSWPTWIWEHFESAESQIAVDGWKWIGDFARGRSTIVHFRPHDEERMVLIDDGGKLGCILGECHGFEVYITSPDVEYVICFNHHDCVTAAGDAIAWLKGRPQS